LERSHDQRDELHPAASMECGELEPSSSTGKRDKDVHIHIIFLLWSEKMKSTSIPSVGSFGIGMNQHPYHPLDPSCHTKNWHSAVLSTNYLLSLPLSSLSVLLSRLMYFCPL
jgi:hypothetical protein